MRSSGNGLGARGGRADIRTVLGGVQELSSLRKKGGTRQKLWPGNLKLGPLRQRRARWTCQEKEISAKRGEKETTQLQSRGGNIRGFCEGGLKKERAQGGRLAKRGSVKAENTLCGGEVRFWVWGVDKGEGGRTRTKRHKLGGPDPYKIPATEDMQRCYGWESRKGQPYLFRGGGQGYGRTIGSHGTLYLLK